MNQPPSMIFKELIVNYGIFNEPTSSTWPVYISSLPDGETVVDRCGAIYDTPGTSDGRLMDTGENIFHPGIMIRVRSEDYEIGWNKLDDVNKYVETLKNYLVTVDSYSYTVCNIKQSSNMYSLGQEKTTKRRELFGCNYIMTIKEAIT